ncbi:allophanate hydrolase [Pseudonocardia spinosispora]|uniref:allophanate hydrolase n=1 Tax=Pseudonocardia spinosispora TaxID=103441 RepID=UPI000420750B|nr:allophanate hydrolase [Pseudonocardia spinosispora]
MPDQLNIGERVRAAYRRIAEVDRPEVWIMLRDEDEVLVAAKDLETRLAAGEDLPLAGRLVAVKDNIDVAGLPTTAACPSYAYTPVTSASAVSRLTDAGALVLGKTNLDQFATGLVGTRSPYGAVRHAHRSDRIAGGSSSGSAVAVALGLVDFALGTDTAGSGRVPAALQGLVGIKLTLGLVPNTGVVPAARPYDCVTVFAETLDVARDAVALMIGPDGVDPTCRTWPDSVRLAAGPAPRIAVPASEGLAHVTSEARLAFGRTRDRLAAEGARLAEIDIEPLLAAATLLYGGALVAERYAAVGDFLSRRPADADPAVAGIILAAEDIPAHRLAADLELLDRYKATAARALDGFDALLLPTTTGHPSLDQVRADPVGVNSRMGVYTNFVNLLDMAAVAVPAGVADGSPFGVSVICRAFDDQIALDIAALLTGEPTVEPIAPVGVDLAVFGAHLRGQPLNGQLVALGARYAGTVSTAPEYRMVALAGDPAKPGVVRAGPGGGVLAGERWTLAPAALGRFLAALPEPMSLGRIRLADGGTVIGFCCDPATAASAPDITRYGSWPNYLAAEAR